MSKDKFKNIKEFENYLQEGGILFDLIYINNIPFTMDSYDSQGKHLSFGNMKHNKTITITTEDRYKNGYKDAVIEMFEDGTFRNDITYFE